ncbi:Xylose isomerase-like TIM barrel [Pirellulimonas nuda]|uniref:Xylose isomerase-like TIM barrel n=1 Tax=Pirellulimonas nuda TaxID=2528009 RepID=A0A518DA54_9BACT|nr:TIM barrel protein [Pirellulimonas nuda]QDU88360.1 Xylose isomerase-like TIM barrel [Pirellulimonas nuda]
MAEGYPSSRNRLAVAQQSAYRWTFDEDLHYLAGCGCGAVGVWRRKLADFGLERACELISDSGLAVSSLFWAGGFTGSDGRSLAASVRDAELALHAAAAIGAECVVLYAGGRNNHTLNHAGRLLDAALDRLLPLAEQLGVPLAIEPMHPAAAAEWTFITDLDQALTLVEQRNSPWLRVVLDTYHFPEALDDPAALARITPLLGLVQLGDRCIAPDIDQERCIVGQGCVRNEQLVRALIDAGYPGRFEIELTGSLVEQRDYERILDASCRGVAALIAGAEPSALPTV